MTRTKHVLLFVAALLAGLVLCLGLTLAAWLHHATPYRTYESPDKQYRLVVYRYPLLFAMPGQSSDAPGKIVLYDRAGRLLQEQEIEMVQLADTIEWERDEVNIPPVVIWKLPSHVTP